MEVIDLFAGMGGLSYGFAREKFEVKGYDINPVSSKIFEINDLGECINADLSKVCPDRNAEIVLGGPPCRPWSSINVRKRGKKHPDYTLLDAYFRNVLSIKPYAFVMENVIPLKGDEKYITWLEKMEKNGYSVHRMKVKYSDFGAPTRRSRLITIGFRNGTSAEEFFNVMEKYKKRAKTVMEAIKPFLKLRKGEYPDHVWPELRTIHKYEKYYKTGKYGWYKLKSNEPAPSFGNIMKTYILHPMSGNNGFKPRVISIREAMSIMGFDRNFRFPEGTGMSIRYQMVADSVSPVVSKVIAKVMKKALI